MKIAVIGGASVNWMPIFMKDFCKCEEMRDQTLVLYDINQDRLKAVKEFCHKVMQEMGLFFTVETSGNLDDSLKGADAVICNVLVGGLHTWNKEINRILEDGIAHPKGMSVGPGGMMMGIKQIPFILDLAKRMEKLCPNAWLLNFSNPMQALMLALQQHTSIKTIGLCHGVGHTIEVYCGWLGVKPEEVFVRYGGVNHFEIVVEMKKDGKDLLPERIEIMDRKEKDGSEFGDLTTKEMYKIFGGLPSNHDIHSIEFYPHYLKRNTNLADYRLIQNNVAVRMSDNDGRFDKVVEYTKGNLGLQDLVKEGQTELLDQIVHTLATNEPMILPANIINNGCITNLPDDICVGVPTVLYRDGYFGCNIGELPVGLDALQVLHGTIQKLIVKAALEGDRQALVQAMTLDPMCYDLSAEERSKMIEDLLEISREFLPAFFS